PPAERLDDSRFLVKDYPKDKEHRRFKLSTQIVAKLSRHVTAHALGENDLLFSYNPPPGPQARVRGTADDTQPGMTAPKQPRRSQGPCPRPGRRPAAWHAGADRARPFLPPRHHDRVQRGSLPMRALSRRLRRLPGEPPRRGQGQPPLAEGPRHGRPHPRRLVS